MSLRRWEAEKEAAAHQQAMELKVKETQEIEKESLHAQSIMDMQG